MIYVSHSKMIRPCLLLVVVLIGVFSTVQITPKENFSNPKENFSNQKRHVLSYIGTQNRHGLGKSITYQSYDGEEFQTFPCVYEGVEYEHGAKFKTGYNTCTCHLGLLACTTDGVHWKLYLWSALSLCKYYQCSFQLFFLNKNKSSFILFPIHFFF